MAGVEPVFVSANGIDFTVVAEIAEGLSARPAREGVGRETRVRECKGRIHRLVGEVREVIAELLGSQHALVGHGTTGEGADIEKGFFVLTAVTDAMRHHAADEVELALKGESAVAHFSAIHEKLTHDGFAGLGSLAEDAAYDRDVAPAKDLETFFFDDVRNRSFLVFAFCFILR